MARAPHSWRRFDVLARLTARHISEGGCAVRRLVWLLADLVWRGRGRAQPAIAPGLRDWAARLLAQLIETAREQAIADGVKPLPASVYRGLLGYFPPALLQKARFGSGHAGQIALPALAFTYGDAKAVTLGDVILFQDEQAAQTDLKLWAHELTHVMQYQRWGMQGFASHYVADSGGVEQEANDNAERFTQWRGSALR
jgi:hypothetical protein